MRSYRAEGVALLAHEYRGTGRVVNFFTRERGKVEAVAQGIGKPGSSLAAAVELFTHSQLFLVEGRILDRLTQARVLEAFESLRLHVRRLGHAGFLCELLACATEPGQPIPTAFDDLVIALRLLDADHEPVTVAAAATWRILGDLGVAPDLDRCVRCGAALEATRVFLAPEAGSVCGSCFTDEDGETDASVPVSAQLRALTGTLGRFPMSRLSRLNVDTALWNDLLRLERLQIRYYLGLELQSDSFLRQLCRPG